MWGRAVGRFPFRHTNFRLIDHREMSSLSSNDANWMHFNGSSEIDVKLRRRPIAIVRSIPEFWINCTILMFIRLIWICIYSTGWITDKNCRFIPRIPFEYRRTIKWELWSIHRHPSPSQRNNRNNLDLFLALFMRILHSTNVFRSYKCANDSRNFSVFTANWN